MKNLFKKLKEGRKKVSRGFIPTFFSVYALISVVILGTMLPARKAEIPKETKSKLTRRAFISALALTVIFTTANLIRRYYTFDRPLRIIEDGLEEIKKGNLNFRIKEDIGAQFGHLDKIIQDINLMAQELSGIETLRNDFLANISHELKAPLAVLMNYGTLLQEPGLSEEKRLEYAKGITKETRKMGSLIGSILKLNRLENQQIYPNSREYDVSEQVIECLLDFEEVWERKHITIQNEIEEGIRINADPELLSPVWENLFSNAVKYTNDGGTITVRLEESQFRIFLTVADNGIGMDEETQAHMFDKFYQGDKSHASEGNGLGMSLVKRILDIVGGTISVESAVGQGSVFRVDVPKGA